MGFGDVSACTDAPTKKYKLATVVYHVWVKTVDRLSPTQDLWSGDLSSSHICWWNVVVETDGWLHRVLLHLHSLYAINSTGFIQAKTELDIGSRVSALRVMITRESGNVLRKDYNDINIIIPFPNYRVSSSIDRSLAPALLVACVCILIAMWREKWTVVRCYSQALWCMYYSISGMASFYSDDYSLQYYNHLSFSCVHMTNPISLLQWTKLRLIFGAKQKQGTWLYLYKLLGVCSSNAGGNERTTQLVISSLHVTYPSSGQCWRSWIY